jgi:GH18 family chitinase
MKPAQLRPVLATLLLLVSAGLSGCTGTSPGSPLPLPLAGQRRAATGFQFVGYWDGWQKNNLVDTPTGVTEIPIAFGFVHGHTITLKGGINPGYVTAADLAALHARGIAVTLSLGGGSPSSSFVFDGNVAGFEASLAKILATLPFDGVDFDLEHGSTAKRVKTLTTLIPATRAYFTSIGRSNAVITYPAFNTPYQYGDARILKDPAVAQALSWVNVMSYEYANAGKTKQDVEAYGAIFDKSRIMMGVDIVDKPFPSAHSLRALSAWVRANGYGGMMAWTVNTITPAQLNAIAGT